MYIYMPDGKTFERIRTVGENQNIKLTHHGFNKSDKSSDGIIFHDMSKNIGQTTKIITHLVNFGQPSNLLLDEREHDNMVQNSLKVKTVGVNKQTLDHKHIKYTQTPDVNRDITFTKTQPIQHYEAGTNTNLASNRFSQIQQRSVQTQWTNTPSQNQMSTLNERCQCEDDEMDHKGIQYRSNFARQLQQSQDIQTMSKYNLQQ